MKGSGLRALLPLIVGAPLFFVLYVAVNVAWLSRGDSVSSILLDSAIVTVIWVGLMAVWMVVADRRSDVDD